MNSKKGKALMDVYHSFKHRMIRHDVSVHGAASSFYLLLSLVPFIILIVQLLHFLPIEPEALLNVPEGVIPASMVAVLRTVLTEVKGSASGAVISVSALAALWSAGKGVGAVRRGLSDINGQEDRSGYLRTRITASFYVVVFLLAMTVAIALILFGEFISQGIHTVFPNISSFLFFVIDFRFVFEILLLIGFILLFYRIVPRGGIPLRKDIPGAVLAAGMWQAFSWGFSLYVGQFSKMSVLYGSMTTLVVIMLWMYFCVMILFIGAEINEMLRNHEFDNLIDTWRQKKKIDTNGKK